MRSKTQAPGAITTRTLRLLALAPLAALAACGGVGLEEEDVTSRQSALSCGSGCQEFVDASGLVRVRVRTCSSVAATGTNGSQKAEARCPMLTSTADSDWNAGYVLVGGGAEIIGSPVPGALLKTSMPDINGTLRNSRIPIQWLARSGQYTTGANHSLRAYWIGVRLVGMTADELTNGVNFTVADGQSGNPFTMAIAPDYVLVGGGATTFDTPNPMFLTDSEPDFANNGWRAEAHTAGALAETNNPKAVSIGIALCPVHADGTQWGCLWSDAPTKGRNHGTGYATVTAFDTPDEIEHPASVVITSVGGRATSTTPGAKRFLTDLIPITTVNGVPTPSATAWSKHTFTPANGTVTAVLRQLAKF